MVRSIVAAFLVTAAAAAVVILVSATGAFRDLRGAFLVAAPFLLFGGPLVLGVVAAWLVPGAWPDRERPLWSVGVGIVVVVAAVCGLLLGGFVGIYIAFATGVFVIGY